VIEFLGLLRAGMKTALSDGFVEPLVERSDVSSRKYMGSFFGGVDVGASLCGR
jgi:hypothetical protein